MRTFMLLLSCCVIGPVILIAPREVEAERTIQRPSLTDRCSRVHNDDTTRSFEPSLKPGFLRAYKRLFPDNPNEPDPAELKMARFRCMDGQLFACFVGANLPCGKLDAALSNRGATIFCRQHPGEETVPMSATGHDTIYFFTCKNGLAKVKEQNWTVDHRGFGVELWKPMD